MRPGLSINDENNNHSYYVHRNWNRQSKYYDKESTVMNPRIIEEYGAEQTPDGRAAIWAPVSRRHQRSHSTQVVEERHAHRALPMHTAQDSTLSWSVTARYRSQWDGTVQGSQDRRTTSCWWYRVAATRSRTPPRLHRYPSPPGLRLIPQTQLVRCWFLL